MVKLSSSMKKGLGMAPDKQNSLVSGTLRNLPIIQGRIPSAVEAGLNRGKAK